MIINDVWGQINIEPKYESIIKSREFCEMKNKTQLGLTTNANAVQTRYQHCIGTYYLACKLIEICKTKFFDILDITKEDEQAIKCMALVHDIGHGCFSHTSEKFLEGSHENRTIFILLNENSEIHQAIIESFGINVLQKTIDLIKMKEKIKSKGNLNSDNSLMLIIGKLLSGGIDIDRIDYIFRDSKYVTGEINDYSEILQNIELENVDDSLEVTFKSNAEYAIANFFNKRFELYDSVYLENNTKILEAIFGKFLNKTNFNLSWDTTEIEMNNYFRQNLSNNDIITKRYANLLFYRKLDDFFIIKEINNEKSYLIYKSRLFKLVPELYKYSDCFFESHYKISIYNRKNKIFINKDGLIQDISDNSKILNSELKKDKYIFGIDLLLLQKMLQQDYISDETIKNIITKIKNATKLEIEQEKKYIFCEELTKKPSKEFKLIEKSFNLQNAEYIQHIDIYYDDELNTLKQNRIALRKRIFNDKCEWTLKRPLIDKTSILKRDEKNFLSLEDAISFLKNEWNIFVGNLQEIISLNTIRAKYDLEYRNGKYEMVFDKTIAMKNNIELPPSYMIECELKGGNSCGLYFIDKIIKQFPFIEECIYSKKEIALNKFEEEKNKEQFSRKLVKPIN
jgi:HD superfamily phosphohydrolase